MNKQQAEINDLRHSLAHLLGASVLELWPGTKLAIGPAVDTGFYYDFDFETPISESDLAQIEEKMKALLPTWTNCTHQAVTAEEAQKILTEKGNFGPYKKELLIELAEKGETLTLYTFGTFTDLCRGGHSDNPSTDIAPDSWKLERLAGAYWRGSEKNPMLTRIYGLAFSTAEELSAYINQQEEAKKRDHRILGKTLKLFTISPLVGSGLPLLQPNGMIIRKEIEDYLWQLHQNKGYLRVWTPHIAHEALYETSGHAAKFGDELFRVSGKEEKFILKPMNCPHHMQIFADNQWSYRDLPVRYFEPATVYRDEKSGQLAGLTRVRAITQDDGHLFCRPDQIGSEVSSIVNIIKEFYTVFGLLAGYWVRLSTRGEDKSKYIGSDEIWSKAETALQKSAEENNLNWKLGPGEAAFYGPKLDFMFKDAIGREWQLATIQCDFNLPERFDLSFTNDKGEKERPVVIHRAISGSLERFMGIMIEHFAGAFPLWLAPTQAAILPITDKQNKYAEKVADLLREGGLRIKLDESKESLGKKIRTAKEQKIPYLIVIGPKEAEGENITVESRGGESQTSTVEDFLTRAQKEIRERTRD